MDNVADHIFNCQLSNYNLFSSDYLGFAGLTIVTLFAYFRPEKSFKSVLILLLLGLFNLLSFAYFFNIVMSFGISVLVTPGIQLISLIMLSVLVIKKREKVGELYRETFGQTEDEKEQSRLNAHNRFKMKFKEVSAREIEIKLQQDLVPEAISALKEIKEERKNALQQSI